MSKTGSGSKKAFDGPRDTAFMLDPDELIIAGYDTDDGPEHECWDERAKLPPDEKRAKTIDKFGVLQTVLITKIAGKPYVVAGRQRVKAARLAKKWQQERGEEFLVRVPCRNKTGNSLSFAAMAIVENEGRTDDDILVKAAKAQRLLDRGASLEECAECFEVDVRSIQNWMTVAGASAAVKSAVTSGKIAASAAVKIAKLEGADAQKEALGEVLAAGPKASTQAARKAVAKARGGDKADNIGFGKKPLKKMFAFAVGTPNDDKDPYWDGFADALALATGAAKPKDARHKKALKAAGVDP